MKFLGVVLAYGVIALILMWGIIQAVHGSYWLLAFGTLGYLVLFSKLGCLPKSH